MIGSDLARERLRRQGVAAPRFERPAEVVRWLGAVQAQDYLGSLWALGLRLRNPPGPATEAGIESAIADRSLLRTWPLRGTIHFVPPEDAGWMLELTAPRVVASSRQRLLREYGLDEPTIARSRKVLAKALRGGEPMPRGELYRQLDEAGIVTAGQRGLHVVWRLAQDGLLCFGPRAGKQPTFVLLDAWAPASRRLQCDEAMAKLAGRYFRSHGPATVRDFAWWSGLTAGDARAGLEMAMGELESETCEGATFWWSRSTPPAGSSSSTVHLLPPYDECVVAYQDRSAILDREHVQQARHGIFAPVILVDGRIAGTWRRTLGKGEVLLEPILFPGATRAATLATLRRGIAAAAARYGEFLGVPVARAWPPALRSAGSRRREITTSVPSAGSTPGRTRKRGPRS